MTCCKAKEYGWCKKNEVVYDDPDGNSFCIFHVPAGHKKGEDRNGFEALILNEMGNSLNLCDLAGTVFDWNIRFERCHRWWQD